MNSLNITIMDVTEFRSLLLETVSEQLKELKDLIKNSNQTSNDVFLTRKEAASLLRISETKLYYLDKNQILPAKRLDGRVLYSKSDLIDFEKNIRSGTPKNSN